MLLGSPIVLWGGTLETPPPPTAPCKSRLPLAAALFMHTALPAAQAALTPCRVLLQPYTLLVSWMGCEAAQACCPAPVPQETFSTLGPSQAGTEVTLVAHAAPFS